MAQRSSSVGMLRASVVVPCQNESGNLPELIDEIGAALGEDGIEVIIVDDGSTDGSAELVQGLMRSRPWLRLVRHARGCGQSAAIATGVEAARAPVIVTLDGDGQNDPADLPRLLAALDEADVVGGVRSERRDGLVRRVSSRVGNGRNDTGTSSAGAVRSDNGGPPGVRIGNGRTGGARGARRPRCRPPRSAKSIFRRPGAGPASRAGQRHVTVV